MVRGDGYNRLPMVRMTNVGLLPGDSSLEEMIAATDDGDPRRHEPVVVDRRQAPELPVRLRDRLGDQARQAGSDDQEPDLHRHRPALLGERSTCSATSRSGPSGARRTAGRASPGRSVTPAIRPCPAASAACGWGCADEPPTSCSRPASASSRLVGTDAEAEVTITAGTEALTRFATSFIHQNVADDAFRVHLRVALDGRVAEATGNQADDEALERLVRSAHGGSPAAAGGPGLARSRAGGRAPGCRALGRGDGGGRSGRAGRAGSRPSSPPPAASRRPDTARPTAPAQPSPTRQGSGSPDGPRPPCWTGSRERPARTARLMPRRCGWPT
jgi:hypothetical protein